METSPEGEITLGHGTISSICPCKLVNGWSQCPLVASAIVHYIAEYCRQQLNAMISTALFSLLMDGSTDTSNRDNECILVQ